MATALEALDSNLTEDQLRLENAYLQGKVEVCERIIKKDSVEPKPEFGFSQKKKTEEK